MASKMLIFDTLIAGIMAFDPTEGVEEDFEEAARQVEAYAKENAPWSDRTGLAREGLTALVGRDGDEVYLELSHTVDYGLWLETIQAGRFAIIMPTLELFAPEVFSSVGATIVETTGGD